MSLRKHQRDAIKFISRNVGVIELSPTKPDPDLKGVFNGNCNRTDCQKPGATWYNHSTQRYYCPHCADMINDANRDWAIDQLGHDLCTERKDDVDSD